MPAVRATTSGRLKATLSRRSIFTTGAALCPLVLDDVRNGG
jgi:hypothetical protein